MPLTNHAHVANNEHPLAALPLDVEHLPVLDDPRLWSTTRKNIVLALVAGGSLIAGLGANIQNPSIEEMERDLPATSSEISLSISLFILVQGIAPLFWSALSEVKGRRLVYLVSLTIHVAGSIAVALSTNIGMVIGFRVVQAAGSSAVMSLGAATLADIYDPHERGTKMGIYYLAPLLGPSIGPLFGGVLTTAFNWRAAFWFLVIVAGCSLVGFILFFKDTYRMQRSMVYQSVLKHHLRDAAAKIDAASKIADNGSEPKDKKGSQQENRDLEKQTPLDTSLPAIKLSLKDVSPMKPLFQVLRRLNNLAILLSSGLYFAFNFIVVYTTSRTLGSAYGYNSQNIGLILLSFGIGSLAGSLIGGRWSDIILARLKAKNGGESYPEMRLKSTIYGLVLLPPFVVAFGWLSERRVHVAGLCVMLFFCGFAAIYIYSSMLAYIVDANTGRSSTATAVNSSFRGLSAFIGTELAVPIQDSLGDGWFYTIFGIAMIGSAILTYAVIRLGEKWRQQAEAREGRFQFHSDAPTAVQTPRSPTPEPRRETK